MFEQIFDNDFVTVKFAKDENIALIKWKENSGNIIDQKQTSFFDDIRNLIKNIAPEKILADMSACDYLLTPDSGVWFKNPIFSSF